MGKPKLNNNKKSKLRSANSYLFRFLEMLYGNLLVENVSLSLASLSIHHVEDARLSARRARIRYLQFKTREIRKLTSFCRVVASVGRKSRGKN